MSTKRTHDHADPELNKIKCPIITDSMFAGPPPLKKQCGTTTTAVTVNLKIVELEPEEEAIDEVFEEDHEKRVLNALNLIAEWGFCTGINGKQWALDQTVRLLCGGLHTSQAKGFNTKTVAYDEWVEAQKGWDTGSIS